MTVKVFISYATGDEDNLRRLYNALARIENVEVHVPEWSGEEENFEERARRGLEGSDLLVVLITFNSTNTMWLNQEIGYASAKNMPVVSIVEKGIDVKGFLEGRDHITFQRGDFDHNVYEVITKMREISAKLKKPLTGFRVDCPACAKKYPDAIPTQEAVDDGIRNRKKLRYQCRFCSTEFLVDPRTLDSEPLA